MASRIKRIRSKLKGRIDPYILAPPILRGAKRTGGAPQKGGQKDIRRPKILILVSSLPLRIGGRSDRMNLNNKNALNYHSFSIVFWIFFLK